VLGGLSNSLATYPTSRTGLWGLRHEVVQVTVMTLDRGHNLMFCHQYPTGIRSPGTMYPHPIRMVTQSRERGATASLKAVGS
jgi:hypothetical protein